MIHKAGEDDVPDYWLCLLSQFTERAGTLPGLSFVVSKFIASLPMFTKVTYSQL